MGGWYAAHGLYRPEELECLPLSRFAEAVRAEGAICNPGCNFPLHTHSLFDTCDVYGHGKPTRIANSNRNIKQPKGSLPISERIDTLVYGIPWFKQYRPNIIDEYANAFRKVIENYKELMN